MQIMLEVLESLPATQPVVPPGSSSQHNSPFPPVAPSPPAPGSAAASSAAVGVLRMWICATLQPLLTGRPRAAQAFLASRGVPLLCRLLAAGPKDVAVHACGVLAAALRHNNNHNNREAAAEAVEV